MTHTERMFGPGIYSTNVSSKADDYSVNNTNGTRTRVMIVNHVALGRSKMMYEASHDMQHAPQMFNSVRGHSVWFNELIVMLSWCRLRRLHTQKVARSIIMRRLFTGRTRYVRMH